jgi:hypothetical protein
VGLLEFQYCVRHYTRCDRGQRTDRERGLALRPALRNTVDAFFQGRDARAGVAEKQAPGISQLETGLPATLEQLRIQNVFQLAQCLGGGRLTDIQNLGGCAYLPRPGGFEETDQMSMPDSRQLAPGGLQTG